MLIDGILIYSQLASQPNSQLNNHDIVRQKFIFSKNSSGKFKLFFNSKRRKMTKKIKSISMSTLTTSIKKPYTFYAMEMEE